MLRASETCETSSAAGPRWSSLPLVGGSAPPGLLERVHKLLALTASPNAHEALAAARAAQALISRHRLEAWLQTDAAADADPLSDGRDQPLERARRLRKWKVALGGALAEVNATAAWVLETGSEEHLCIAGRARDRALVQALYEGLARRIEWASATAGAGRPRAWHEAFRIGMADAIAPRLAEVDAELEAGSRALGPAGEGALVRIAQERAALERFLDERFGPGKGRRLRVDARAYARGRAAGAELPLPRRR
jgi:hypothetical protein